MGAEPLVLFLLSLVHTATYLSNHLSTASQHHRQSVLTGYQRRGGSRLGIYLSPSVLHRQCAGRLVDPYHLFHSPSCRPNQRELPSMVLAYLLTNDPSHLKPVCLQAVSYRQKTIRALGSPPVLCSYDRVFFPSSFDSLSAIQWRQPDKLWVCFRYLSNRSPRYSTSSPNIKTTKPPKDFPSLSLGKTDLIRLRAVRTLILMLVLSCL